MADPTTSNVLLAQPLRGADSGTWDVPLNGNAGALDGLFGGQATIVLASATTLLLTVPATGSVSPTAGPNQSWNACLKLSGTMTGGNSTLQLTMPHRYIIDATGLTTGTSCVLLAPASGTGSKCGVPWGEVSEFWFDGTNVSFKGLDRVGSYLDLAAATTPSWITQSSVPPYVLTDGSVYSTSLYPALGAMLGSTFGGNGITTFGVPDTVSRMVLSLDVGGAKGRVTSAGSGINGAALGATGGSQFLQAHTHTATVGDNGHSHDIGGAADTSGGAAVSFASNSGAGLITGASQVAIKNGTTGITVTNASNGTGSSQNMPPAIIGRLQFIRAG